MNGTIQVIASVGGVSVQSAIQRSAAGALPSQELTLDAGQPGTLSTRTSDTAGTLTMETGHGLTDDDVISIFWTDANGDPQFAYDATVGVVAGNSVPFTGATGTVLPAEASSIVADIEEELDVDFDGDKLEMLAAAANRVVGVQFVDSGDAVLDAAVRRANEPYQYVKGIDASNPLTGNPVDAIRLANGDSANSATWKMGGLYNSDE